MYFATALYLSTSNSSKKVIYETEKHFSKKASRVISKFRI